MLEHIVDVAEGAALMGAGIFLYLTVKNGVPWAWSKLSTWWTATKTDLASAKTDIASLKADVAALKVKVGI
jgi:hypothetical protein